MIDWKRISESLGYDTPEEMFRSLYIEKAMSIAQIAQRFAITPSSARRAIMFHGVPVRSRGGPNNQKVIIDEQLVHEVESHGVIKVARSRGVDPSALYKSLYYKKGYAVKPLARRRVPEQSEPEPLAVKAAKHHAENQ